MRTILVAAAIAVAASAPIAAVADDAAAATGGQGTMGTMVCRPASAAETPTAMMVATKKAIICKPVTITMKDGKIVNGPNLTKALSPEQADAAWQSWIMSMFQVGGGGG